MSYGDAAETFNPIPLYDIHNCGPAYTERDDWPTPLELLEDDNA